MTYKYLDKIVDPLRVPFFNSATYWKPVHHNDLLKPDTYLESIHRGDLLNPDTSYISISMNTSTVPMFKVEIGKDYYFIFEFFNNTNNNILKIHICKGFSILKTIKTQSHTPIISDVRTSIIFNKLPVLMFAYIMNHPLIKFNLPFNKIISFLEIFEKTLLFNFYEVISSNISKSGCIQTTILKEDSISKFSSTHNEYKIVHVIDGEVIIQKYVDPISPFGRKLEKFITLTTHKQVNVLVSMDGNYIYFLYSKENIDGLIKADLKNNTVSHLQKSKDDYSVSVRAVASDINLSFFGMFDDYFADSLVNSPSEEFIKFANENNIDLDNILPMDCLTLVEMATI
jgi:hypothetical protein